MTPEPEEAQQTMRTIAHLSLAFGLALAVSGAVVVASRLLPPIIDDTTARVWIGVSLAGIWIASLAALAVFVDRHVRRSERKG